MKEVREVAGLPSDMIGYMYYYLAHYDLPEENSEAADGVIEVVIREIARYLSEVQSDEKDITKFLKAGDKVLVKGEGLGSVEVNIVD